MFHVLDIEFFVKCGKIQIVYFKKMCMCVYTRHGGSPYVVVLGGLIHNRQSTHVKVLALISIYFIDFFK